ncbi:3-phosphoserine/phosphohydroxythreonine aminotransferase [Candidatus Marinamargulisbacteria bacterium SCGC AG-414-C22]|nr:3-phosphoserine/phosphohydroxythreonine aminotransferase [Candidatus Marinamargulisbacteria bacterium SCGC AG-414-C22]
MNRIFNFSAGPATMPIEVLKKAQEELLNFDFSGMSVMEMSHRSKSFENVLERAKSGIISLLNVPDNYDVLFIQGGASLQFSMVAKNLFQNELPALAINTGSWAQKAIKEIKKEGICNVIASSEDKNFSYLPDLSNCSYEKSSFTYLCSNNTIFGTQFKSFPDTGDSPLVADMSSDILSRPLNINQFGVIFAGAQKNIGPSGIAIVIIRKDLAERAKESLPSMLQYRSYISSNSLYNTIPTFQVYMTALVAEWLQVQGGLTAIQKYNQDKANLLYDAIDNSDFYYSPVNPEDRSLMNVVFRISGGEELEKLFVKEATEAHLSGLKGHRSVGGLRASIYNAHPREGVEALVSFMNTFKDKHA